MTGLLTRDKYFYKTIARLTAVIILQNIFAYSVNTVDNIMLGTYGKDALSVAAAANHIQLILQIII